MDRNQPHNINENDMCIAFNLKFIYYVLLTAILLNDLTETLNTIKCNMEFEIGL